MYEGEILKKMRLLNEKIKWHNYLYYEKNSPEITDEEYDALLRELIDLEKQYPGLVLEDSVTKQVGSKPSGNLNKVRLHNKMLSLSNAFNEDELKHFNSRIKKVLETDDNPEYCVELKIDGLSVELTYEYGKLTRAATRGDGETGEDVTKNIMTIDDVPKYIEQIKEIPLLIVTGEVYMKKEVFEKLNKEREEKGLKVFANPRNCASGSLRQLNPEVTRERKLNVIVYNINNPEVLGVDKQHELLLKLSELGFNALDRFMITSNLYEILRYIRVYEESRDTLEFDIDGMVVKLNNIKDRNLIGETEKYLKWAIAYKFKSKKAITKLEGVRLTVGRTGVITPTALLSPVRIAGTVVSKASLHNQDIIDSKDIRIGDYVEIHKAGDIIPEIIRPIKEKRTGKEEKIIIPNNCPVCGSEVVSIEGEVALRCVNPQCPAQLVNRIVHFVSKDAMNIEGLGEKQVKQLFDNNLISDVSDIYRLEFYDIYYLEGQGEKSASNLLEAINNSKYNSLERLLYGLGIPLIGLKASKIIAKEFGNMLNIVNASYDDFVSIPGIGHKMALSLVEFFNRSEVIETIYNLSNNGVNMEYISETSVNNEFFNGKTVVITGTFELGSRDKLKSILENMGAKVTSSVSNKTDYLLCGVNPGSKLDKALDKGIRIIEENELRDMLNTGL